MMSPSGCSRYSPWNFLLRMTTTTTAAATTIFLLGLSARSSTITTTSAFQVLPIHRAGSSVRSLTSSFTTYHNPFSRITPSYHLQWNTRTMVPATTTTTTTTTRFMATKSSSLSMAAASDNNNTDGELSTTIKSEDEKQHMIHQKKFYNSLWEDNSGLERIVKKPIYQAMAKEFLHQFLQQQQQHHQHDMQPIQLALNNNNNKSPTLSAPTPRILNILDVGCGTGILWEFLMEAANIANVTLNITGVDMSSTMVQSANRTADFFLERNQEQNHTLSHSIQIIQSDIVEYCQSHHHQHDNDNKWDAVIMNNCFGNFWNPRAVLKHLLDVTTPTATIVISHPYPPKEVFSQQVPEKRRDLRTIPHDLPQSTKEMISQWTLGLPLSPTTKVHTTSHHNDEFYLMTLQRVPYKALVPHIQRYRGAIDHGYGRGGKKLGVPTANLPASLFQQALESVSTGVYFGWAVLEEVNGSTAPSNLNRYPYKAVVNVGYSPTFQGQENKEKIIEAHLIRESDKDNNADNNNNNTPPPLPDDFYGRVMRLQLVGFIRPEKTFRGLDELMTQIHADIQNAREALEYTSPFQEWAMPNDNFLLTSSSNNNKNNSGVWIGSGGGDEAASWEFVNHHKALLTLLNQDNKK